MTTSQTIDVSAEPVPESQLPARIENQTQAIQRTTGLFGTDDPVAVITRASSVAAALKDVIKQQGLISNIQGKEYPKVEAWTLLGTMIGVFPVLVWSKQVEGGWEARVEARTKDGSIVGAAEAECLRSERNWKDRDDYALRSMAQTRATAKCLRMPLGFVMTLAGYEATPAEEMPVPANPRANTGTSARPAPQPTTRPAARTADVANLATEAQKAKFITKLEPVAREALELFTKWGWITSEQGMEDIPLAKVPTTERMYDAIMLDIKAFMDGDPVNNPDAEEPFWDIIIPVPRRGEKRADYMKNPDTIRSLYEAGKNGDDDARKRLFGFANNWQPTGWEKRDGTKMPPSEADNKAREALDQFLEWEKEKGN